MPLYWLGTLSSWAQSPNGTRKRKSRRSYSVCSMGNLRHLAVTLGFGDMGIPVMLVQMLLA
jgi:hypothetical protein